MAAYAALVSLMNNIEQIQSHTRLPIRFDPNQSEALLEKVNSLIDFLEKYHYHGAGEEMEDLESRITDAAYAAEDIIETHVVDKIHDYSRSINVVNKIMAPIKSILRRMMNETDTTISASQTEKNPYLPGIDKVMEDMDFIKEEAMKIKHKRGSDGVPTISTVTNAPSSSTILFGENVMVGFEKELMELLERLTWRHSSRQVIPIVGMGGKGKTTLARTAYEKPLILQYFVCRAWVSISQEYNVRQILLGLLRNVASQMGDRNDNEFSQMGDRNDNEFSQIDDHQIGERLRKILFGRRYLIVLDDIWSTEAWESVMSYLPENNNGSRIIVTTRISNLAIDFGWSNLEVNFLDEEKGWILFCEKVFSQECCPCDLEGVGRKIVKNCQGLPLSIVVIGGLLAKSERTTKYWEYIARDTSAVVGLVGGEMSTKILYLSYHNLPVHLKPCFLYMGVFREDEEINVSQLIKLWVSEGFLKPNSSKELEVVANEYLNDIISRNLLIVRGHGSRGKINRCMIHDLLRNLCLKEARKGKFLCVPTKHDQDEVQNIGNQRRISVPALSNIPKHLGTRDPGFLGRSLLCQKALPLKNFKLLRVLHGIYKGPMPVLFYKYASARYRLGDTFNLVNLRLISVGRSGHLIKFPSSICLLWNLQILIIADSYPVAPLEIWQMTELRHLEFHWGFFPIMGFSFSWFEHSLYHPGQKIKTQDGDAIMKNLHTLKGIRGLRLSEGLIKRIPNLKRLKLIYTLYDKFKDKWDLKYINLFENLESLSLACLTINVPRPDPLWNLTFPNSLKKLSLWGCGICEDISMIASLPHLQVLKLKFDPFKEPRWELHEEDIFRRLKYLEICSSSVLEEWIADNTHFPCLEHLCLKALKNLVEIPSGIGDTLQLIELHHCSKSAINSAKKILDEQEGSLKVEVTCNKEDVESLVCLASEKFIVLIQKY